LRDELQARRAVPLYGSVDPETHRPAEPNPAYACDVSYLGTYAADRQPALERLFLEPARRLPWCKFLIGGAMYPSDFPWSENIYFVRHVPPPDHPAFYSSSRLTLNITRAAMALMGYCPSGRLFEAAACGTPVLTDYWEGLEHFFEPGREILLARDSEEAVDAISRDQASLAHLARAARERVLAEHTAAHRARELTRLLEPALRKQARVPVEA
jgi:spore maturation protein CgeB